MAILAELHQEHVNLKRLLEMLARKVQKFRGGTHPNFQLMSDVVGYIGNYADVSHHPREDRLHAHLRGRDADLDAKMAVSEQQHQELKQATHDLYEAIEGVLHDAAVVPMDRLIDQLDHFVTLQSAHLDFEESAIFPKLEQVATEADWRQIEADSPQSSDPLFGLKQAEEYRDLYRALLEDNQNG